MKRKVRQYKKHLPLFECFFEAPAIVLFILDIPRCDVKRFINEVETGEIFYFTDLASFMQTPKGKELDTPIFLWGGDKKEYPLRS
jgi:hypothetical protein